MEPKPDAEDEWVDHVQDAANRTLFPRADAWYMGANIPGKPRLFMPYIVGVGRYRTIYVHLITENYNGFVSEPKPPTPPPSELSTRAQSRDDILIC